MSNQSTSDDEDRSHLDGIEAGAGCVEIWERLSEQRGHDETPVSGDD